MKTIPLSRGFVALVDDEDYTLLAQHSWRAQTGKGLIYAVRRDRGRLILMHRVILDTPPGAQVDHRQHAAGMVVDNRRSNLRLATVAENSFNRGKPFGSTYGQSSIFKGVRRDRERRKWRAQITVGGRHVDLGRFGDEGHAAAAYDLAAVRHFGDFAVTNFPVPGSSRFLFGSA